MSETKFYNTAEFKKLDAKWKKKLKDSGFEDAEQEDGRLKLWASHFFGIQSEKRGAVAIEAIQEYYRMAGQFRHDYKFKSALDRMIWEMHAEGDTGAVIIEKLKAKGITAYKDLVYGTKNSTINRLFREMIRFYEQKRLNND